MKVLVAGGCGYIGSHTMVSLLESGYDVVCVDNLSNSSKVAIDRVEKITGKKITFYDYDLCEKDKCLEVFKKEKVDSVIMFAGLKAVGESTEKPLLYYHNNIESLLNICFSMSEYGCKNIIFSSSATVYGEHVNVPAKEDALASDLQNITNPYGRTKSMIESILIDFSKVEKDSKICLLRYFNPVGAHKSGLIGEDPKGIPNNLMPYIAQTAIGKREKLHIFGDDYKTKDGTGVRDYIHVVDLARGHVLALEKMNKDRDSHEDRSVYIYNLGTGKGTSVLEVLHAYEKACGHEIPYVIDPRRPGDIDELYCDPSKAKKELLWEAKYDIDDMCVDSYNFQSKNPNGYN
ncbi:MAG: UDP-glucose 4-epimerase GalE [Lachnospiraceae bacterium]|nr:UDP-glucose 4-epimerase GalE [Lachnospiraceae bacterium]